MQVERPYYLSSVERELYFPQWAKKKGIELILFDLDDTICATRHIFVKQKKQILDHISSSYPFLTPIQWENEIEHRHRESFEKHGVNPDQYNLMTDNLCDKFNLNNKTRDIVKGLFKDIYNTPVTYVEGAEKTLEFLKKIDIPIGIVTHANRAWTYEKYRWLDLQRFINWDDIYIVNEDGHKNSE